MKRIEHIGIAVKRLSVSIPLFEKLLDTPCYKTEVLPLEQVNTAFFEAGKNKIELLEAYSPESVIDKFIEKRGEGLHHIAFQVDDIEAEMKRLESEGFTLLNKEPKDGANMNSCFFLRFPGGSF